MSTQTIVTSRINRQLRSQSLVDLAMSIHNDYDSFTKKLSTQLTPTPPTTNQLLITNGQQRLTFTQQQIQWIEAAGDYVNIYTTEGKTHLVRSTMKSIETNIGSEQFMRIHRSFIVNKSQVKRVYSEGTNGLFIILANDKRLTVSRRFSKAVMMSLTN